MQMIGVLNYDIWRNPTGYLVDDLRIKRDFPSNPEVRRTLNKLKVVFFSVDVNSIKNKYGHKVYGYLLPKTAGQCSLSSRLVSMYRVLKVPSCRYM